MEKVMEYALKFHIEAFTLNPTPEEDNLIKNSFEDVQGLERLKNKYIEAENVVMEKIQAAFQLAGGEHLAEHERADLGVRIKEYESVAQKHGIILKEGTARRLAERDFVVSKAREEKLTSVEKGKHTDPRSTKSSPLQVALSSLEQAKADQLKTYERFLDSYRQHARWTERDLERERIDFAASIRPKTYFFSLNELNAAERALKNTEIKLYDQIVNTINPKVDESKLVNSVSEKASKDGKSPSPEEVKSLVRKELIQQVSDALQGKPSVDDQIGYAFQFKDESQKGALKTGLADLNIARAKYEKARILASQRADAVLKLAAISYFQLIRLTNKRI
ncbi:hypothetical protein CROQUDRAFT_652821 [Cronartium quercuum f. sp. fusiforme G11]|uniref:Uncharacterized protein n=1 Tax=Cronartium quercuum f. sp. fusiforme G11 TaxID=708437 RepID=A0A9P6NQE1_9BASI|nr:hypothetical protein CROQUDRAFT_652821 [Cronartium quercuum f. sp. fusiforme G11]